MAGLKSQPEFESQDDTTTETTTATKEKAGTKEAPAVDKAAIAAGLAAATAIAKAATGTAAGTAVVPAKAPLKYRKAFEEKENAYPLADVMLWFQASPSITHTSGCAKHSKKGSLGTKFVVHVDSYNMRFLAVPGSNDKEAKSKVRNSYDKKTIVDDGSDLQDYVDALKAEGYAKAHVEPYVDLWGRVVWSEKFGTVAPDDDSWDVRVQLSKTSASNFGYFQGKRGRAESEGRVGVLEDVEVTAVALEGKSGDYTNFDFAAPKAV